MKHFFLTSIIISLLLASCNPDKNKRADPDKLKFSTTDDATLFFKNLRRQAYDLEDMPEARLQVFRHADRNQKAAYPFLQLAIVVNWRYAEAYLLLEPNQTIASDVPMIINWSDSLNHKSGSYRFEYGNKEAHLRFASQLYGSILDGHLLEYISPSGPVPFLPSAADRKIFRISMLDYYRLTGNIR